MRAPEVGVTEKDFDIFNSQIVLSAFKTNYVAANVTERLIPIILMYTFDII